MVFIHLCMYSSSERPMRKHMNLISYIIIYGELEVLKKGENLQSAVWNCVVLHSNFWLKWSLEKHFVTEWCSLPSTCHSHFQGPTPCRETAVGPHIGRIEVFLLFWCITNPECIFFPGINYEQGPGRSGGTQFRSLK